MNCIGSQNQLRQSLNLTTSQILMVEIISPLSFTCAICSTIICIKIFNTNEPPADILLMLSIFSLLRLFSYCSTLVYNSIHPPTDTLPADFDDFCTATGIMNVICDISQLCYNIVFCIYYLVNIRNPLKTWAQKGLKVHLFCLFLIIVSTLLVYLLEGIGISILGVCAFKINPTTPYIDFSTTLMFLIILLGTSVIFLKYLHQICKHEQKAKPFFIYYCKYILMFSTNYFIQTVGLLILAIDCTQSQSLVETVRIIVNTSILSTPIVIFLISLNHPHLSCSICKNIFSREKENCKRLSFYSNLLNTHRRQILLELNEIPSLQSDNFKEFKQKNKVCLIATILGCISIQEMEFKKKKNNNQQYSLRLSLENNNNEQDIINEWNYYDNYQFKLTDKIINHYKQIFVKQIPKIMINFISYTPHIFHEIKQQDQLYNVDISLNPQINLRKICNNVGVDGGNSGQFFYFSQDNRLIIKTITNDEKNVLLNRIRNYYLYLNTHPESFIVKIYGIYSAINIQSNEEIHFILMGNLMADIDPIEQLIRVYDMKGSSHNRQVIKHFNIDIPQSASKTLKDTDFNKIEKQVWISQLNSEYIKTNLQLDSNFFYQEGLIDYSLILIKIKIKDDHKSKLRIFQSEKQKGIAYIIGIIDYLETWNFRKKGQKWYKSIWTNSKSISSQNPIYYSQRFMNQLVKNIFP